MVWHAYSSRVKLPYGFCLSLYDTKIIYRPCPWGLHRENEVDDIGRSQLQWFRWNSIFRNQGSTSGNPLSLWTCCLCNFFFPVVKFYSEGMCYYHRLQKMRSNIGLLKQLPQSFLIVRWIRWTKQLLWGKCQCVLTHLHSLICTLFCESWSVVVWCAVGMQIVCLGQHNGKLSCQNLEFGG